MKRVLVTGGAAGIGLAIARRFLAEGDQVVVCDVDEAGLAAAYRDVTNATAVRCDVSVAADLDALFGHVDRLDVLVANVGIGGPTLPAEALPGEEWRRVIDINLTGTFEVTQRAIPLLKASGGTIVVMSSAAGRYGYPNRIAYSTTKWGLVGFAKTLAMELGQFDVTANAILPGAVGGERFDRVMEGRAAASGRSIAEETAEQLRSQSLKRVTSPEHVADLCHFLTTPAGRSISGQALPIDCDLQHG